MKNVKVIAMLLVCLLASLVLVGCGEDIKTGQSTKTEMEQTEVNQLRLAKNQPPPSIDYSMERENLIARLKDLNLRGAVGYVYTISFGKVMGFYTIKGKVSSLNSLLTTPEQIVTVNPVSGHYATQVIKSPDFDGSYAENPKGIFFFTTDGTLIEWSGDYQFSRRPVKLREEPQMVLNVDAKGNGIVVK